MEIMKIILRVSESELLYLRIPTITNNNQTTYNMKALTIAKNKKGFSLVELLVVIAVIGVIAAIAIPAMSSIFGESKVARDQRNAQNIVSIYQSARSSGVTGITTTSKDTIITALEAGVTVSDPSSPFQGKRFSIGTMAPQAKTDAKPYLKLTAGELDYVQTGGDTGS